MVFGCTLSTVHPRHPTAPTFCTPPSVAHTVSVIDCTHGTPVPPLFSVFVGVFLDGSVSHTPRARPLRYCVCTTPLLSQRDWRDAVALSRHVQHAMELTAISRADTLATYSAGFEDGATIITVSSVRTRGRNVVCPLASAALLLQVAFGEPSGLAGGRRSSRRMKHMWTWDGRGALRLLAYIIDPAYHNFLTTWLRIPFHSWVCGL